MNCILFMQRPAMRTRICARLESESGRQIWSLKAEELKGRKRVTYQGDIHVLGDVGKDVTIRATGSIAVWGIVKGCVHVEEGQLHAIDIDPEAKITTGHDPFSQVNSRAMPPGIHENLLQGCYFLAGRVLGWIGALVVREVDAALLKTAFVTGSYATVLGMAILCFPVSTYGLLFDTALLAPGLIRLGGSFLTLIGLQYLGTSIGDGFLGASVPHWLRSFCSFYHSTVISRVFLVSVVVCLASLRMVEPTWLVFAAMNAVGAWSMFRAIHPKKTKVKNQE